MFCYCLSLKDEALNNKKNRTPFREVIYTHMPFNPLTSLDKMKFYIVKPFPFPIRIPLAPKYSPQDPVFEYPSSGSPLNLRDDISQPYRTTSYIIVLCALIFKSLEVEEKKDETE